MIVFCEECGAKNDISPEILEGSGPPPRCENCNDILRIYTTPSAATVTVPLKKEKKRVTKPRLVLTFHNQTFEVDESRNTVTMGRQEYNDIEVLDNRVSRSHAVVEFRKGKFILIDRSTNGTFVMFEGQEGISLKRKELALKGKGIIGLGWKVDFDSPDAVHFVLK